MKKSARSFYQLIGQLTSSDTYLSLAIVGLLVLMVVPMKPFLLDFFLATSIAASFGILLMAVYHKRSSELSIFPTLLLLVTLYRLALNVASTRLILTNGKNGASAAGELIAAFGDIVIHGNTFVGVLVFIILNVINFIVITKGSGRISEVAARFMLDSLPGKQMSIDADLKSGAITPDDARNKRMELDQQADFYGAMDGASKFVKGDAVAGLVITGINIMGGLFVGIAQEGMSFSAAIKTYTLLTIGDGLVAQFPALIVSTAAGIVVTKASSSRKALGEDFALQLMANPRLFFLLSGILFVLGLFMKSAGQAFYILSAICAAVGFFTRRKPIEDLRKEQEEILSRDLALAAPTFEIQVGLGLAHQLYQDKHFQEDLDRFVKELSQKNNCAMPPVRVIDSSELDFFEYAFVMKDVSYRHQGTITERSFYVLGTQEVSDFDPRFLSDTLLKRPCAWVSAEERESFINKGFVVVSAPELFRWHLFLAYREALQGQQSSQKGTELIHGSENL